MSIMQYLADRLQDRNSWIGLTTFFGVLGYHLTDAELNDVITIGAGVSGLIVALWPVKTN